LLPYTLASLGNAPSNAGWEPSASQQGRVFVEVPQAFVSVDTHGVYQKLIHKGSESTEALVLEKERPDPAPSRHPGTL
jgi:hypothetical protein